LESVIAYLAQENVSDPSLFQNESSAQRKAARFMAETDGYNLTVPTIDSRTLDEGYYFVFRYVMIVFYFALRGENWTIGTGFLSSNDTCYWFEPILNIGVWCVFDEQDGTIIPTGLIFRKSRCACDRRCLPTLTGTLPASFKEIQALKGGFFDGTGSKNNTLDISCEHKTLFEPMQMKSLWLTVPPVLVRRFACAVTDV
jgi:hypothetical protein